MHVQLLSTQMKFSSSWQLSFWQTYLSSGLGIQHQIIRIVKNSNLKQILITWFLYGCDITRWLFTEQALYARIILLYTTDVWHIVPILKYSLSSSCVSHMVGVHCVILVCIKRQMTPVISLSDSHRILQMANWILFSWLEQGGKIFRRLAKNLGN